MKAATYKTYGGAEVIQISEVSKPEIKADEVLVKIFGTSINYADYAVLAGNPYLVRLEYGILKPKYSILGMDYSGVVEQVGNQVKDFKVGDHVFGELSTNGMGAMAEYRAIPAKLLVKKDPSIPHELAASVPLAGVTALQGLRDYGHLKAGMKVLVNGASSGVGSFAIQIAKAYGAHVTALASEEKLAAVQACGADRVLDYKKVALDHINESFDIIFDCAMYQPSKNFKGLLTAKGTYIGVGGKMKHLFNLILFGKMKSKKHGIRFTNYLARFSKADLEQLHTMLLKGQIKPLVYKTFDMQDSAEAFKTHKSRKAYGKITIRVS